MRFLFILLFLLALSFTAFGQMEKTIHNSFLLENVNSISLNFNWEYELVQWEGSALMTETIIKLHNASPAILNYLIDTEKRYGILSITDSDTLQLKSTDKKREFIQTRNGVCSEIVLIKVHLPRNFVASVENPTLLVKKTDSN